MIRRRTFLKTMAAGLAVGLAGPAQLLAASKTEMMVGIQLYTIRDLVAKDFDGSLKKLAQIGYNTIEAAGYSEGTFYGMPPLEYKKRISDLGMIPLSSHAGVTIENVKKVADDHLAAGISYLVLPWIAKEKRRSIDDIKKLSDELNRVGEQCNRAGLRFAYHNHAFEFEEMEGIIPYDVLLKHTENDQVCMQLDIYWMLYGGHEPLAYFEKYPGRFELWHIKDMSGDQNRESTEVGSGIIDFPALFAMKSQSGLKYHFVEQEAFKMDPMESVAMSCNYLKQL